MSLITRAFVGHIRGGLAQTAIVGNVFLSGISGFLNVALLIAGMFMETLAILTYIPAISTWLPSVLNH